MDQLKTVLNLHLCFNCWCCTFHCTVLLWQIIINAFEQYPLDSYKIKSIIMIDQWVDVTDSPH